MMIVLVTCLIGIALLCAIATGEIALIIVTVGISLTFFAIVAYDLAILKKHLLRILKGARRSSLSLPLLSSTSAFSDILEVINARINRLENEVELLGQKATYRKPLPAVDESNDWLIAALRHFSDSFHGAAVGIVLPQGDTIRCATSLPLGKRFEGQLLGLTEGWLRRGDEYCLGIRDTLSDKGFWGDFSPFGYSAYIVVPLRWSGAGDIARGALWVGFPANRELTRRVGETIAAESRNLEIQITQNIQLISLEKRVLDAEANSDTKSEFIAHMSHDIRSPLNNIRAILHLLQNEEGRSSESSDFLQAGMVSCENVSEMLESLLDYSKFKAGKLESRTSDEPIAELVKQGVVGFELAAKTKGLALSMILHAGAEGVWSNVDKRQIKRVMFNLISNAIKYTEAGSVKITFGANDHEVTVAVTDTGRGMSKEQLSKVFIPFERLPGDSTEGVGIGLMLSRELIKLNRGVLSVSSVAGTGTTVTVVLPRIEQALVPARVASLHPGTIAPVAQKLSLSGTVLLVDDDVGSSNSLRRLLERSGMLAMVSAGVNEALSVCAYDAPDLIITDLGMPDGGGRKLLNDIREKFAAIPVLVLTGSVNSQTVSDLVSAGAKAVFEKPVDLRALLGAIAQVLPPVER